MSLNNYDNLTTYCPQLGGLIPFHFCRVAASGILCRKVVVCWEFSFDIASFLVKHYTPEELKNALAAPTRTRLAHIVDCAQKAIANKNRES